MTASLPPIGLRVPCPKHRATGPPAREFRRGTRSHLGRPSLRPRHVWDHVAGNPGHRHYPAVGQPPSLPACRPRRPCNCFAGPAAKLDRGDRPQPDRSRQGPIQYPDHVGVGFRSHGHAESARRHVAGLPGVALSDQTGNQFQLDLNYRGFTASPVIGTRRASPSTRTACASTKRTAISSTGISFRKRPSPR